MSRCHGSQVEVESTDLLRRNNQMFNTVRKAWRLTAPESYYREPRWLRAAASMAGKAGRLPKLNRWSSVIDQLHGAGYSRALDHIGIIREQGQRHVIFEPYECSCSMDTARRIAEELASKLKCRAWVSFCSWHVPGATIRITLAPLHTLASVATVVHRLNQIPSQPEVASVGGQWPQGASASETIAKTPLASGSSQENHLLWG
jgi:hypothetical protein